MIRAPGEMVAEQPVDDRGVEETTFLDACAVQDVAERGAQRATEPLGQRHREAVLATTQRLRGQSVGERVLEEPLELAQTAQAERPRNGARSSSAFAMLARSAFARFCPAR